MNRINVFKTRDFGDLFQDSFQYIFRNAKSLLLPLLMWVVPLTAISGILNAYHSQDTMDSILEGITGGDMEGILEDLVRNNELIPFWIYPVILVIAVMATGMTGAFIYEHMLVHLHEPEKLEEPEHLRDRAFNSMGRLIGSFLVILAFVFLGVLVFSMLVAFAVQLSPVIASILGFMGFLGLFYAGVPLYLVFIIQLYEDVGPIEAIKRSFKLIRGNWWMTFGLVLVLSILLGLVAAPVTASLSLSGAMGIPALIFGQLVLAAVSTLVNTPVWVAVGLQYFNITDMSSPGDYMEEAIDQIGNE
ncbi:MAG: hypothetical protein AB8H47_02795 [Bacteroidia bacterium]